jgi:hypothetical protein
MKEHGIIFPAISHVAFFDPTSNIASRQNHIFGNKFRVFHRKIDPKFHKNELAIVCQSKLFFT